jgi:hypothetical protein
VNANTYDFARSFLQFTTDHADHTPRLQIEASCALTAADGVTQEFFLAAPCMSEHMYRDADLAIQPTSLFWMIARHNDQFLMQKCHAATAPDVREAHRVGERMSTSDGTGATMLKLEITTRHFPRVRSVETYKEIREAILSNHVLNGQTSYTGADGTTQVRLRYPIKICNIAHGRQGWQIDTGPIVMPDPSLSGELAVARLNAAFILFNSWTWAECALRRATPVGPNGGQTQHYSDVLRLDNVRNELFCAD